MWHAIARMNGGQPPRPIAVAAYRQSGSADASDQREERAQRRQRGAHTDDRRTAPAPAASKAVLSGAVAVVRPAGPAASSAATPTTR